METYLLRYRTLSESEYSGDFDEHAEVEIEAEKPTVEFADEHVRITCEENGVIAFIPNDDFWSWNRVEPIDSTD
jgi:hypothetical protein